MAERPDETEPGAVSPRTEELDAVEQRPRRRRPRRPHPRPPQVRLGTLVAGGLAPAILAIVERGVRRRPALAHSLQAEVELELEDYPPVRIVFAEHEVLVEDGPGVSPDLRVEGALPDLISLMVAPLVGGVPSPIRARGRAALGHVALGRVRVDGRLRLLRRFLRIIRV